MSNYRYEGYGVVRDLKDDIPYHTDDIVDLLEEKDQQIVELQKQLKQLQKQLAIEELEKIKNYFDDSDDDKYNESEGWIITNRNVVEYVNNQIKQLKEMK